MAQQCSPNVRNIVATQHQGYELRFLAALVAYLLVHLLIRVQLQGSLERDEAEIVYLTQELRLGYGTQPPLYAWLQWLVFSVFGLNRFSLVLLKDLILIATYAGMYRLAKPLVGTHGALAAAASLLLFPQIGWESLRDLTHSVLLTTFACLTLWSYFAVLRKPDAARYALLGLLAGLGLQTKYNFAIFLSGLIFASLLVRQHRRMLWNRKLAISAAVAIAVLLPHGLWLAGNLQAAAGGTLNKMAAGTEGFGYWQRVAGGLSSALLAAVAFAAPVVLAYAWASRGYLGRARATFKSPEARFFLCLYGGFLLMLVGIVLTGEVGKIKDRWMMPLLFSLPLAFFLIFPDVPRQAVFKRIWRVVLVVAMLVLLLMPLRTYFGPRIGKIGPPHYPYPELAAGLAGRFPGVSTVIAKDTLTAGNLHFQRPGLRTVLLEQMLQPDGRMQGEVLLVMQGDMLAESLDRIRQAYPLAELREQGRIDLHYRFGGKGIMSFDYVHIALGGL